MSILKLSSASDIANYFRRKKGPLLSQRAFVPSMAHHKVVIPFLGHHKDKWAISKKIVTRGAI